MVSIVRATRAKSEKIENARALLIGQEYLSSEMASSSRVILSPPAAIPVSSNRPTLVYWNIRGLAQACRLALEYSGEPYDDVRIEAGKEFRPRSAVKCV